MLTIVPQKHSAQEMSSHFPFHTNNLESTERFVKCMLSLCGRGQPHKDVCHTHHRMRAQRALGSG